MRRLAFLGTLLFGLALFLVSVYFGLKLQETDTTAEFWSQYVPGAAENDEHDVFGKFVLDSIPQAYSYLPQKETQNGFQWQDLRLHYVPRLHATTDPNEYLFILDEMLSLLDDGHTQVLHAPLPTDRTLPVSVVREADGFRITAFTQAVAKAYPTLEPGMTLVSVDGVPVQTLWAELVQESGYQMATQADRLLAPRFFQSYYFYRLRGQNPPASQLTVADTAGRQQELALSWQPAAEVIGTGELRSVPAEPPQGITSRSLAGGAVGYIRVDALDSRLVTDAAIEEAFAAVASAPSLVLDIRGNTGGDFSHLGVQILSHLVSGEATALTKEFRYSPHLHLFGNESPGYPGKPLLGLSEYSRPVPTKVSPSPANSFAGKPVILLVDERNFSSADILIAAFSDLKLGRIAGRLDRLHFGQPLRLTYPYHEGWGLSISSVVARGPSGVLIESRPVTPDIVVPLTRSEILGESDPILEAALGALK